MKKSLTLISALVAVIGMTLSGSAHARSIIAKQSAQITRIQSQQHTPFVGGKLVIDYVQSKVQMQLWGAPCPAGARCFVAQFIQNVELPLVSRTRDNCGVAIYKAEKNLLKVDGGYQSIEIRDYTHTTCKYVTANPDTAILYRTLSGARVQPQLKNQMYMEATRLQ